MKAKLLNTFVVLLFLLSCVAVQAQSLVYSNAIETLNPAGYWPMHELEPPAQADIETNYGSLGALGNGYYADWALNNGAPGNSQILHGYPSPIANVTNSAEYFTFTNGTPNVGTPSYLLVPRTSPLTTLQPPFSIEAWCAGWSNAFGDVASECGTKLNSGNDNNAYGVRFSYNAGTFQTYGSVGQGITTTFFGSNIWVYAVLTCDSSKNWTIYMDNAVIGTHIPGAYINDTWDPLTVGAGMWNGVGVTRQCAMGLDEVAIYTNALSANDISNKWYIATNSLAGPNDYHNAVIADNPLIYFRMDSPAFQGWAPSNTWPVLKNYGTTATNGFYMPGAMPGGIVGPNSSGVPFSGVPADAMPDNEMGSFADLGHNPTLNPTGNTPFSVAVCFTGNPADSRIESLVGHGDTSWHLRMDTTGKLRFGTGAQASDLLSTKVYNDGSWHVAVAEYNGGTNYIYVDGALDTSASNAVSAIIGTNADVLVGADPEYMTNYTDAGMQFGGNICDAAFFTNVLTAAQVQSLYNAIGAPITTISGPVLNRVGSSDTFSVTANGSSPVYQWYFNTVSNYSGATVLTDGGGVSGSGTPNLTIANLTAYYFAVATNLGSSITSSIAQVPQLNVVAAGEPMWNTASQTNVIVTFSYPLAPVSATMLGNYALSPSGTIHSATVVATNEVVLVTSALSPGTSYSLMVQNVTNAYGVPLAPSPTNLAVGVYPANLAFWVKATNGVTADVNGNVSEWDDMSGNGNNLYQVAGGEPVVATNAFGQLVIRFYATNDDELDAISAQSLAITGDMSIIAVMNFATLAGGTNGEIVSKTGSSSSVENIAAPYDYYVGSDAALYRGNGLGTTVGTDYGAFGATIAPYVGVPQIMAVSETGNTISHYVNGQAAGTGVLSSSYQEVNDADAGQDMTVGSRSDKHDRLTGDISELIVAGSPISAYDVAQFDNYLSAEYNVVLFNPNPTNIVFSTSATNLTLSWPADHTGWQLQVQTNKLSIGLSTNWVNVANSQNTNQVVIPLNLTNGSVFYRLTY